MFYQQEAITAQSFYQPIRTIQKGDLEEGFKQADHILEGKIVLVFDGYMNEVLIGYRLSSSASLSVCSVR